MPLDELLDELLEERQEFLHLPTAQKLTAAVALVLDAHATR